MRSHVGCARRITERSDVEPTLAVASRTACYIGLGITHNDLLLASKTSESRLRLHMRLIFSHIRVIRLQFVDDFTHAH